MNSHIHIRRIGSQALPDHEASLAMRIAASAEQFDRRLQKTIARNALPNKVEGVIGEPHVLATARENPRLLCRIRERGARLSRRPDIGFTLKRRKITCQDLGSAKNRGADNRPSEPNQNSTCTHAVGLAHHPPPEHANFVFLRWGRAQAKAVLRSVGEWLVA